MFQYWLKKIYYGLLPSFCMLCRVATKNTHLCESCVAELPWQENTCKQCGRSLPQAEICGSCLQDPPPYHSTICLFHYQSPLDSLVLSLKFAEKLSYARLLGDLMAERIRAQYINSTQPECIIPVPLHAARLKERGYNQALEIARPIARQLQIPLQVAACTRVLPTLAQASTTATVRRKNMKDAFVIDPLFKANHVAIVDDVVTTGSTVKELALALKRVGVGRIDVWCCARTVLRKEVAT